MKYKDYIPWHSVLIFIKAAYLWWHINHLQCKEKLGCCFCACGFCGRQAGRQTKCKCMDFKVFEALNYACAYLDCHLASLIPGEYYYSITNHSRSFTQIKLIIKDILRYKNWMPLLNIFMSTPTIKYHILHLLILYHI